MVILTCGGGLRIFKTRDNWIDKYDQTEENGHKVNYKNNPVVSCADASSGARG